MLLTWVFEEIRIATAILQALASNEPVCEALLRPRQVTCVMCEHQLAGLLPAREERPISRHVTQQIRPSLRAECRAAIFARARVEERKGERRSYQSAGWLDVSVQQRPIYFEGQVTQVHLA